MKFPINFGARKLSKPSHSQLQCSVNKHVQNKRIKQRLQVRIKTTPEEKDISPDNATNKKAAVANLEICRQDIYIETFTSVVKRKTTEEKLKVAISRKRTTSLSVSSAIANMQKGMDHVNPDIPTKNRYSVFADYVIIELDSDPKNTES